MCNSFDRMPECDGQTNIRATAGPLGRYDSMAAADGTPPEFHW